MQHRQLCQGHGRAVIIFVVLTLAIAVHRCGLGSRTRAHSDATQLHDACRALPGLAAQLCSSYHSAAGPEKFTAAVHWRQLSPASYACSGVTVECLQADMSDSSTSSSSSCRPLAEGGACVLENGEQQLTCSQGFCGGSPKHCAPADPKFQPGVSSGFAPVGFSTAATSGVNPNNQQLAGADADMISRAKTLISTWRAATGLNPDQAVADDDDDYAESASRTSRGAPRFLQAVTSQVNSGWPTAYAVVKYKEGGRRVPDAFLATSHEWTRLQDYGGDSAPAWAEIFKVLGPSPVLRIGGATQDKLVDVPKEDTWTALAQLQKLTNARFIIGLPLFQKNAVEMSRQMIKDAKKYLGSSVIGYELGNEPEFWPAGLGGYDDKGNWQSGFAAYTQWFDRVARTLNPCGSAPFLSGPGWGNLNTQDPNWLKIVLSNGKACGYLWEANAHYYPYINNATVTADELLSQSLQNVGLDRLAAYRKIAQEGHGLQLRISEANSLYGGGRADLSDTMAGTLWVADALFAFAAGGARAFHLHWGHGGLPFQGGSPNVGVQTNFDYNTPAPYKPYPSVHAPWYGYLFWVTASAGGYNKNADSQFVSTWFEKRTPPAPTPAPAPSGNATSSSSGGGGGSGSAAPAAVITEKGAAVDDKIKNQISIKDKSNKRIASADAMKAHWREQQQQHKAQAQAQAQGGAGSRKLLQNVGPCEANIKLWALKAGDGTLRVAVLNKDSGRDCNVRISIPDAPQLCKEGSTSAELSRLLPGPGGMSSKSGLSWQGQHYEDSSVANSGKLVGSRETLALKATKDADGCAYVVGMPRSSGALLLIKG